MKKILIADDNEDITDILSNYIEREGYEPIVAVDGEQALELFEKEQPALVLLDIMMPKIDGYEVCRNIRKKNNVPIILVTARGEDFERVMGLDIGADDYIVKPFEPVEVIARINAHLRREENKDTTENVQNSSETTVDNISINLEKYEVKLDGNIVEDLKPKEIQLLYFFLTNKNQVFTREQLLDKVWGYEYFGGTRTVDVHIKSVREKLSSPNNKWEIKTIWNVGYKFETKEI